MVDTTHYRLVIADDHPLFRGALRAAVAGLFDHVDIGEAGSFDDVAKLLERGGEVDLILLDLSMPGMQGDELGRRLRSQPWAEKIPIVALSALGDDEARRRTAEAGFDLHLVKPTLPDELARLLTDLVILRGNEMNAQR